MKRVTHICDICKKEQEGEYYTSPEGWKSNIEIKYGQYNTRTFDVCPECQPKLGIPKNEKGVSSLQNNSVAERLLEIIQEICQEVTQ